MKRLPKRNGVAVTAHTPGTSKGEEMVIKKGREAGRDDPGKAWRTARDATSINPDQRDPIDPRMPYLPPA